MKYGVNRQVLLITAGIVWIVAGANILRIGIVTWLNDSQYWLFKVGEATVVFLLFFVLVFLILFFLLRFPQQELFQQVFSFVLQITMIVAWHLV